MPPSMTLQQIDLVREAGIPVHCNGMISRLVVTLSQRGIKLDWDNFLTLLSPDPPAVLKQLLEFVRVFL